MKRIITFQLLILCFYCTSFADDKEMEKRCFDYDCSMPSYYVRKVLAGEQLDFYNKEVREYFHKILHKKKYIYRGRTYAYTIFKRNPFRSILYIIDIMEKEKNDSRIVSNIIHTIGYENKEDIALEFFAIIEQLLTDERLYDVDQCCKRPLPFGNKKAERICDRTIQILHHNFVDENNKSTFPYFKGKEWKDIEPADGQFSLEERLKFKKWLSEGEGKKYIQENFKTAKVAYNERQKKIKATGLSYRERNFELKNKQVKKYLATRWEYFEENASESNSGWVSQEKIDELIFVLKYNKQDGFKCIYDRYNEQKYLKKNSKDKTMDHSLILKPILYILSCYDNYETVNILTKELSNNNDIQVWIVSDQDVDEFAKNEDYLSERMCDFLYPSLVEILKKKNCPFTKDIKAKIDLSLTKKDYGYKKAWFSRDKIITHLKNWLSSEIGRKFIKENYKSGLIDKNK